MLFLTRKVGQSIYLFDSDDNVIGKLKINSQRGNQISVGLALQPEISAVRDELLCTEKIESLDSQIDEGYTSG